MSTGTARGAGYNRDTPSAWTTHPDFAKRHHHGGHAQIARQLARQKVSSQIAAAIEQRPGFDLIGHQDVHVIPRQ